MFHSRSQYLAARTAASAIVTLEKRTRGDRSKWGELSTSNKGPEQGLDAKSHVRTSETNHSSKWQLTRLQVEGRIVLVNTSGIF